MKIPRLKLIDWLLIAIPVLVLLVHPVFGLIIRAHLPAPAAPAEANFNTRMSNAFHGATVVTNNFGEVFQFTNGGWYYKGQAK